MLGRMGTVLLAVGAAAGMLAPAAPAGGHALDAPPGPITAPTQPAPFDPATVATASTGFEQVGHTPLGNRGMNAAIAVHNGYVYVGSRTDGSPHHLTPGILVVDARNPAAPTVVHEIGQPDAGLVGETSRELRVWPEQNLLIVMNFQCSSQIHACAPGDLASPLAVKPRFTVFDISGAHAARPKLMATHKPARTPHEMFLWIDPAAPATRAKLFWTSPTTSTTSASMFVTDLSQARAGVFPEVSWTASFAGGSGEDRRLHSMAVSHDGTRAYLAFLGSGYLVLDTSAVARGDASPVMKLITQSKDRARWGNPGTHTATRLPGRAVGFATDEVYGDLLDPVTGQNHGCPWGWVRLLDLANEAKPAVIAEYKVEENAAQYCADPVTGAPTNTVFSSFASHNPTFTEHLAFVTWHSAGLEVIDTTDPRKPMRAGKFKPAALPAVVTEDPALSLGVDRVVMWSYPIISSGLVYVLDLRNGLYILRYTGPHADEVTKVAFTEGNSNAGDAGRIEAAAGAAPPAPGGAVAFGSRGRAVAL